MLEPRRIGARHYYDNLPKPVHECGDVWTGLPTMGILGGPFVTGIVITPACDLSQRKTETVTYLPVVSVLTYFSTVAALPEIRARVEGNLRAGNFDLETSWAGTGFRPAKFDEVIMSIILIEDHLTKKQRAAKEVAALGRACAGLRLVACISKGTLAPSCATDLSQLFGADWARIKDGIIRNSYRNDLHFLPSDEQGNEFTGLSRHSVVLTRYPLTIPIEILDIANNAEGISWEAIVEANSKMVPSIVHCIATRPIKTLSLRKEFLPDLLSRYLAIYSRSGSPDFTRLSRLRLSEEIDL